MDGEETFLFFLNRRDREPNPELWRERQRQLTTSLGPRPSGKKIKVMNTLVSCDLILEDDRCFLAD